MALIEPRSVWSPRYENGDIDLDNLAEGVYLHHTAGVHLSADASVEKEYEVMRGVEATGEDRFHYGISYNVIVFPSGRAYQGVDWNRRGAHTGGLNTIVRSICFAGNYENKEPTEAQLKTASQIYREGRGKWWVADAYVKGHRDRGGTACPGDNIYKHRSQIKSGAYLDGAHPEVASTPTPLNDEPAAAPANLWGELFQEMVATLGEKNVSMGDSSIFEDKTGRGIYRLNVKENFQTFLDSLVALSRLHPRTMGILLRTRKKLYTLEGKWVSTDEESLILDEQTVMVGAANTDVFRSPWKYAEAAKAVALQITGEPDANPAFDDPSCLPEPPEDYDYEKDGPLPYKEENIPFLPDGSPNPNYNDDLPDTSDYNKDYKDDPDAGYPSDKEKENGPKPSPTDLVSSYQLRKFNLTNDTAQALPLKISVLNANLLAGVNNYVSIEVFPTKIAGYLKIVHYKIDGPVSWDNRVSPPVARFKNGAIVDQQKYFTLPPNSTTEVAVRTYGRGTRGDVVFEYGRKTTVIDGDTGTVTNPPTAPETGGGVTKDYYATIKNVGSASIKPVFKFESLTLQPGFIKILKNGTRNLLTIAIQEDVTGTLIVDTDTQRVLLNNRDITDRVTGIWSDVAAQSTDKFKISVNSAKYIRGRLVISYSGGVFY